ncbi:MAG TPA: dihydroorotate dehydrogenase electron transfer subunit [candidate division Zixibacteria bacterium]|nr:dihydroorotate dehydrogenase electron transfer subunit [candidate division Zixibacteria bacterium]
MPVDVLGKITDKRIIARDTVRIVIDAPSVAENAKPGQFVMVSQSLPTFDPFLRRPIAISGAEWGRIELIVRVVGWGTAVLANSEEGDQLRVLGPLGIGFPPPAGHLALVAGGIGIAPLLFAGRNWAKSRLFYGETTADWICDLSREKSCEFDIATDDGSVGEKCNAVELLKKKIDQFEHVFACGPEPMLHAIAKLCKRKKIPCAVSLEERMACGVGACQGCTIKTKSGYRRVCKDGPVFDANEIIWEELDERPCG